MFGKNKDKKPKEKLTFKQKRQKKKELRDVRQEDIRRGLIFWLPGGSSRLDVYLDYCVIRCLGKTKMEEKERVIPFTSILDVVYTPPTTMRFATLQLITKEMPNVKRSAWYPYENNMVVVHPEVDDVAQKCRAYILDPHGSNVVPPDFLNELKKEARKARREEQEKAGAAQEEAKTQPEAQESTDET
jgi:hypothetical protein